MSRLLITILGASILLAGCHDDNSSFDEFTNNAIELRALAQNMGLTGDPSEGRILPNINEPLPQLGAKLFFSKSLGGDFDAACVSCHHPALGGGDDLSLPIGVTAHSPDLLGPGRTHPHGDPAVPRNAPTTFNIGLWDEALFHDGRVESIGKTPKANGDDGMGIRTPDVAFGTADVEAGRSLTIAQARFPVTSAEELRGFVLEAGNSNNDLRLHLAARLQDDGVGAGEISASNTLGVNNWLDEFRTGFVSSQDAPTLMTFARVVEAIAAYENSQVFVNSPWRAYMKGDNNAMSASAQRGANLFFKSTADGGANCASCHSGDFFTDEKFHVIALPQLGRGKGDGTAGTDDFGRARETGNSTDNYKFRTPTLTNVEVTKPYGHSGAFDSLEQVIRHHLNPSDSIDAYFADPQWCRALAQFDNSNDCTTLYPHAEANTRAALAQLETNRATGASNVLRNVTLSDDQVDDLVQFMLALTDPCVKDRACLAPWIPANGPGPDGNQLNAIDANGNLL